MTTIQPCSPHSLPPQKFPHQPLPPLNNNNPQHSHNNPKTMLSYKESPSGESCLGCLKNNTLIKKYEQLIHLYKKKQVRVSGDGSSRISNGRTSSQTVDLMATGEGNCVRVCEVLEGLVRRRLRTGFQKLLGKNAHSRGNKLAALVLASKVGKLAKMRAFMNIKSAENAGEEEGKQGPLLTSRQSTKQSEHPSPENRISVIQQLIMQANNRVQEITAQSITNLTQLRQQVLSQSARPTTSSKTQRNVLQLQIQNKKLTHQNSILRQCVEDVHRRQIKQNEKKRESLEMLAEEISEKNQEIVSLKQALRKFEIESGGDLNVLEEDVVTMRSQIEHLERIKDRLHSDLDKVKDQLEKTNKILKQIEAKCQKLQKQHLEMQKKSYEAEQSLAKSTKIQAELTKTIVKLTQKIKRLSLYQKQLQNPTQFLTLTITQQLKSQLILLYLTNLGDPDYKLQNISLFDQEERTLLENHKQEWIKLLEEEKMLNKIEKGNKNGREEVDISGIQGRGGHMDSIFQALDSPRDKRLQDEITNRQGPTMRMLQLQLQKNKQIQKISELKQKFLHIRVIILQLLKSLELQPNVKQETQDILRLLFDVFEYSEQERDSIFVKKRKLFNLF